MKETHPLLHTLFVLKGNQRACVVTEPLWAIPNYLILPFVSVYMAGVGLNDTHIGIVTSFGLAMQFLWALFSGAIVDKYGRRRTMLVFGLLSWTIPCALWAASQGYWYFMVAVFFNSMWRITGNSFSCMIVEDGDSSQLINIYTILSLFGLLAGFISPIIGFFIGRYTLLPTMRIVYLSAMILMTVKFLLQFRLSKESDIGIRRRSECKQNSLLKMTFGGWREFTASLWQTNLLLCIILMILVNCFNIIQSTFLPLFYMSAYGVKTSMLSILPLLKTITTILVYLMITSRIQLHSIRVPLLTGLGSYLCGVTMLIVCIPLGSKAIGVVFLSAVFDALAAAILVPLYETLMSVSIPGNIRARVNSFITAIILLICIPVGWLSGILSQQNRVLPLAVNYSLIIVQVIVALLITRNSRHR